MNKKVYHIPLSLLLLACSFFIIQKNNAQPPVVTTSVDKTNILIGEQLHYKVSASMPDNTYTLTWFTLPDSLGNFKVVSKNKIDSSFNNGTLGFSQSVTLTSFDSGRQVIPQLTLHFETQQGDSITNVLTDSIAVNVGYSPLDSIKTFHDIKSIIEVKKEWQWWWWALLAAALIAVFFWVRFLIKFFKKKNNPELFKSRLSPYDEAMQSLSDLQKEQLLQKNEPGNHLIKEYHTRLTDIFKRYLSRKSSTYMLHLTSDEILMSIGSYGISQEKIALFANSLRMSNAVKFAKFIPSENESQTCMSETKEMITEINKSLQQENRK